MRTLAAVLLLAAPASAQVVRLAPVTAVPLSAAALSINAPLAASPLPAFAPLAAPSLLPSPALPHNVPAAASPAALTDDREAALVEKLAGKLCSSDCVSRRKTASWIAELAAAHPREAVQSAAVRGLVGDAARSNDLMYFEHVTGLVHSFAAATPHDSVFASAVDALIAAARESGRAQRTEAVAAVVRLSREASPERRARAAQALETLRAEPAFRADPDALDRAIARVRG